MDLPISHDRFRIALRAYIDLASLGEGWPQGDLCIRQGSSRSQFRVLEWRNSHCAGTSAGAPLSLIKSTRNFAGWVPLAFRSAEPFVQTDAAEARLAQRHERYLLHPAAEVSGLGAARDHTRVADRLQVGSNSGGPDLTRREANI